MKLAGLRATRPVYESGSHAVTNAVAASLVGAPRRPRAWKPVPSPRAGKVSNPPKPLPSHPIENRNTKESNIMIVPDYSRQFEHIDHAVTGSAVIGVIGAGGAGKLVEHLAR